MIIYLGHLRNAPTCHVSMWWELFSWSCTNSCPFRQSASHLNMLGRVRRLQWQILERNFQRSSSDTHGWQWRCIFYSSTAVKQWISGTIQKSIRNRFANNWDITRWRNSLQVWRVGEAWLCSYVWAISSYDSTRNVRVERVVKRLCIVIARCIIYTWQIFSL